MYIRRKVFSLLREEEERLFSILDDEDLEQREFGRKQKLARKAERAAHNAEMHANKAARLAQENEKNNRFRRER